MNRDVKSNRCEPEHDRAPKQSLIAVGGLSGSGKSTLSRRIRDELLDRKHDTVWIRSDVVRKELWGFCDYADKLPPAGYSDDMNRSTAEVFCQRIEKALQEGKTVVADATFLKPEQRRMMQEFSSDNEATFIGLWLKAPTEEIKQRVDRRFNDASDADSKIVDLQLSFNLGQLSWNRLDASGTAQQTWREARKVLDFAGYDLGKKIEWHDVLVKSREGCHSTGAESFEMQLFYKPFIHTVVRGLLDNQLKGYSDNGAEPEIFAEAEYRFFVPLKGPEGVCFDADELSTFTEKFSMTYGNDFETGVFETAKNAFIEAIRKTQSVTQGNNVLKEIEFSCNGHDFEQEIGGAKGLLDPRPKFLH